MVTIVDLLEEHRKAFSADLKANFSTQSKAGPSPCYSVRRWAGDCVSRVNANLQDGRMLALEATCATLTEGNAKMLAKVTDLESSS